jgi:hypothetical protein
MAASAKQQTNQGCKQAGLASAGPRMMAVFSTWLPLLPHCGHGDQVTNPASSWGFGLHLQSQQTLQRHQACITHVTSWNYVARRPTGTAALAETCMHTCRDSLPGLPTPLCGTLQATVHVPMYSYFTHSRLITYIHTTPSVDILRAQGGSATRYEAHGVHFARIVAWFPEVFRHKNMSWVCAGQTSNAWAEAALCNCAEQTPREVSSLGSYCVYGVV